MKALFWSVKQQNCRPEVEVSCCWNKCQNRITQAKNYTKFFSWGDHTRHLMKNFLCIKLFQKWQIVQGKRCVIIWTIAEYPTTYCNILVLIKVSIKSRVTHIVTKYTVSVCISKSFSKDDLIFERTRTLWKLQREYKLYKRIWPKLSPFNDSSIENAHIGHSSEVRGVCLLKWHSKMFYRNIWKLKTLRKLWKWACI